MLMMRIPGDLKLEYSNVTVRPVNVQKDLTHTPPILDYNSHGVNLQLVTRLSYKVAKLYVC